MFDIIGLWTLQISPRQMPRTGIYLDLFDKVVKSIRRCNINQEVKRLIYGHVYATKSIMRFQHLGSFPPFFSTSFRYYSRIYPEIWSTSETKVGVSALLVQIQVDNCLVSNEGDIFGKSLVHLQTNKSVSYKYYLRPLNRIFICRVSSKV